MTDVASYLRGFIAGYWAGFDFAVRPPTPEDVAMTEEKNAHGSAGGGAETSSTAPALDLGSLPRRGSLPSSSAFAVSSLPAIRQPALPDDLKIAGALEGLYVHRGMVLALGIMAELFAEAGDAQAATICEAAIKGMNLELAP